MKMLKCTMSWCGMMLLPILFLACSKEDQPSGPARMMFINGLTDGNASTIQIADSTILALTAGFGNVTLYNQVNGGIQTVTLKDNIGDGVLASKDFNISPGKDYTLMAVGNRATAELLLHEDDLSIPDTTKAYIRLINLSPNSNLMTMYMSSGPDVASGISYKSISGFMELNPDRYELNIRSGNTLLSTITNLKLLANKKYSILVIGMINQTPKASYNIIVNK